MLRRHDRPKQAARWARLGSVLLCLAACPACTPRPHEVARAFCAAVAAQRFGEAALFCAPGVIAAVTNAPAAKGALQHSLLQCDWQVLDMRWSDAGLTALVPFAVRHAGPPPPVLQGLALLHLRKHGRRWRIDDIAMQFTHYTEFALLPQHAAHTNDAGTRMRQPVTCAVQESLAAFMQRYDRYCRSFID
jgi:hypothetical protein